MFREFEFIVLACLASADTFNLRDRELLQDREALTRQVIEYLQHRAFQTRELTCFEDGYLKECKSYMASQISPEFEFEHKIWKV